MKNNKIKNDKRKSNIVIYSFLFIITIGGLLSLIFPVRGEVSEQENRALAKMPAVTAENFFSGKLFRGIEDYYSDHFFHREKFIQISKTVENMRGLGGKEKVQIVATGGNNDFVNNETDKPTNSESAPKDRPTTSRRIKTHKDLSPRVMSYMGETVRYLVGLQDNDPVAAETEASGIVDNPELEGHKINSLLVVNDSAYEIFGYSEKSCDYYAQAINGFADKLEAGDKVYSLVAPSKIAFIPSQKYRSISQSQEDAINYIGSRFSDKVKSVNVYNTMAKHAGEYLYFRSDHHWTALGAYYAYTDFAQTIGDKAYGLDAFEKVSIDGFLGTLYKKANKNPEIKANPDRVDVYKPFVDSKYTITTESGATLNYDVLTMSWAKKDNKYMVFLSGDNPLAVIDTELNNNRKIMVFKDSYGNAFVPFLISHYDEIHIIDPRHYKQGAISYAKEHGIHEFLFLNYDVVIAGNTKFADNIIKVSH